MNQNQKKPDIKPVALLTGAARRIGATTARMLHERGMDVIIHCHRSQAEAQELVQALNAIREDSAAMVRADLNDMRSLPVLVQDVSDLLQGRRLQLLVNNASRFYPTPLARAGQQDWDDLFNSNVRAAYFLSQQLAPLLRQANGCIINLIDIYAQRPLPQHSIYCMAKAALQMMTLSLAQELAPEIRVNGVAPGAIIWPEQGLSESQKQTILERVALQRSGAEGDIAKAVAWLAQEADYVTGQIIAVDGGRSLTI
jgi:pteridine reductase